MRITSLQNETIKGLLKLKQKKHRDQQQHILIEGEHLLEEARKKGLILETFGVGPGYDVEITEIIAHKLSETQSGSLCFARIQKPSYTLPQGSRYLLCDGIQDPGNLGTIIRTAHSFDFDAVLLSVSCADEYNDKVIRSTQGAVFHIPVLRGDLLDFISVLKQEGMMLYATHLHREAVPLAQIGKEKVGIVLGSEGQGVSEAVLEACDANVMIETANFESLNVAVAAGILCYTVSKE